MSLDFISYESLPLIAHERDPTPIVNNEIQQKIIFTSIEGHLDDEETFSLRSETFSDISETSSMANKSIAEEFGSNDLPFNRTSRLRNVNLNLQVHPESEIELYTRRGVNQIEEVDGEFNEVEVDLNDNQDFEIYSFGAQEIQHQPRQQVLPFLPVEMARVNAAINNPIIYRDNYSLMQLEAIDEMLVLLTSIEEQPQNGIITEQFITEALESLSPAQQQLYPAVIQLLSSINIFQNENTQVIAQSNSQVQPDLNPQQDLQIESSQTRRQSLNLPIEILTVDSEEICTICLYPLTEREVISRVQCGHAFHLDCLSNWTVCDNQGHNQRHTCPNCRRNI